MNSLNTNASFCRFKNTVWHFHPDDFDDDGESHVWLPQWYLSDDKKRVDYCTILGMLDPSIIALSFYPDDILKNRLNEIHERYYRCGMVRNIAL